jgi:hypothetical protein
MRSLCRCGGGIIDGKGKGKGEIIPEPHHEHLQGNGGIAPPLLTLALGGGELSVSRIQFISISSRSGIDYKIDLQTIGYKMSHISKQMFQ